MAAIELSRQQLHRLRGLARIVAELEELGLGLSRSHQTCVEYRRRQLRHRAELEDQRSRVHPHDHDTLANLVTEIEQIDERVRETDEELAALREKQESLTAALGPRRDLLERVLVAAHISRDQVGAAAVGPQADRSRRADVTV